MTPVTTIDGRMTDGDSIALQRSRGLVTPVTSATRSRATARRSLQRSRGLVTPVTREPPEPSSHALAASTEPGLGDPGDVTLALDKTQAAGLQRSRGLVTPVTRRRVMVAAHRDEHASTEPGLGDPGDRLGTPETPARTGFNGAGAW